jgi:hypothetical protein
MLNLSLSGQDPDEWLELVCPENRQWHPGTYSDVPTEEKPDF